MVGIPSFKIPGFGKAVLGGRLSDRSTGSGKASTCRSWPNLPVGAEAPLTTPRTQQSLPSWPSDLSAGQPPYSQAMGGGIDERCTGAWRPQPVNAAASRDAAALAVAGAVADSIGAGMAIESSRSAIG